MTTKSYLLTFSILVIVSLALNLESDIFAILFLAVSTFVALVLGIILKHKLNGSALLIIVTISATALLVINLTTDFLEQETIRNGNKIVSALNHYQEDNKTLPVSLDQLKPKYIEEIPPVLMSLSKRGFYYQKISDSNFVIRFSAGAFMVFEYEGQQGTWHKLD